MGTVDLKKGINTPFSGALGGVLVLFIANLIVAGVNRRDFQVIPTLSFDSNPFKFVGDYLNFFTTPLGLVVVGATLLFYILGTYYVGKSKAEPPAYPQVVEHNTAALLRGLLIGLGSGMNLVLAENIYGTWFGSATEHSVVGLIIGIVLFVLGMLASIKAISQNSVYQGIIGWLDWFAPMSWPVELFGIALGLINLFFWLIGLLGVDWLKVTGDDDPSVDGSVQKHHFSMDWATGTFFMIGGLVSNLNLMKTAFNLGNIGFIYYQANKDFREHEAGHNLSLFVFGWIFHLLGWIDEMIHSEALAERLAASHGNPLNNPTLEMWTT